MSDSVSMTGAAGGDEPPAEFVLPHTALSQALEGLVRWIGEKVAWIWVPLVLLIVWNVFSRYVLGEGRVLYEEMQWHMYAIGFMIGLSYCMIMDSHVRVDVLADRWRTRTRAWVELFGLTVLFLPFVGAVFWESLPFVQRAWDFNESSAAPDGLPWRWFIKAFMPIGFLLLILAGIGRWTRCTALLFGFPEPRWRQS